MSVLIKSAKIIDKNSPYNGQVKNILVVDGKIKSIGSDAPKADQVIEGKNLHASIGWFDMRVTMGEPGLEHKEDIESISKAAAAGGFTEIACMPTTKPSIQTKDAVAYIKGRTANSLVAIHPIASVTLNNEGKELTEMIDLHHAGAVAFTDGDHPIWHTDVMLKSLQYAQTFDGLIINHAEDKLLTHGAQMNESETSTRLGLKGFPALSEELMIARDIQILEYTGGKIHFPHVASPKSLELIRTAKKQGLKVTCDIAAYQLILDEKMLTDFDTNLKVNPPLRSAADIKAYWKALEDDTIDAIVSDHIPQDSESKNLEFDLSDFGMIGLETLFGSLNQSGKISLEKLIHKISYAPREILSLNIPIIKEGSEANLTIFDSEEPWTYEASTIKSKSKNSPFIGQQFKGKVKGVLRNGLVS